MGKIRKTRKRLHASAPGRPATETDPKAGETSQTHRTKKERRLEFLKKLEASAVERRRHKEKDKGRDKTKDNEKESTSLGQIGALQDSLDAILEDVRAVSKRSDDSRSRVTSNRARALVAAREIRQFQAVVAHEGFKADPFSAIQEHLKQTLDAEEERRKHKERREARLLGAIKKKGNKKMS